MAKKPNSSWYIYIIECVNGKLYTGITSNLEKRFKRHCAGKGARFTKRNRPSHMIAAKPCKDRSEASKLEYAIKQLKPKQKRTAVEAWPMKKDLPKA